MRNFTPEHGLRIELIDWGAREKILKRRARYAQLLVDLTGMTPAEAQAVFAALPVMSGDHHAGPGARRSPNPRRHVGWPPHRGQHATEHHGARPRPEARDRDIAPDFRSRAG
jgi:hypothetical protein